MQSIRPSATRQRPFATRRAAVACVMCAALVLGACSDDTSTSTPATATGSGVVSVGADGVTAIPGDAVTARLDALPKAELTPAERDGLAYMREEERARRGRLPSARRQVEPAGLHQHRRRRSHAHVIGEGPAGPLSATGPVGRPTCGDVCEQHHRRALHVRSWRRGRRRWSPRSKSAP